MYGKCNKKTILSPLTATSLFLQIQSSPTQAPHYYSNPPPFSSMDPSSLPISPAPTIAATSPYSVSPLRRSRTRLANRLEAAEDDSPEPAGARRRCKRGAQAAGAAAPSPRKAARKPRRRSEPDVREEKDLGLVAVEEVGKPRKRRNTVRSKKEKSNLVAVPAPSISAPKAEKEEEEEEEEDGGDLERVGQVVGDLIMWKDLSKSTLWFGLGSLCFLSSSFSHGLNFSLFSAMSQLAIVFLGVSFFSNSIFLRNQVERKRDYKLKEDDILRLAKLILPPLNLAISKTRELFSGEPSMTLKVAPFLLLGAEYGHFITIWRLCAIGFLLSFSAPKLYSCYTSQINHRAECLALWLLEAWCACTHKKKLVGSALVAFWNLSSIKTRVYTAFILLVLFRYLKQHVVRQLDEGEAQVAEQEQALVIPGPQEKEQQQEALVVEGPQEKEQQQEALVVAGADENKLEQALVVREQDKGAATK